MSGTATAGPVRPHSRIAAWFFNAYVQIAIGAVLVAAAELLLKYGASSSVRQGASRHVLGLTALISLWTWLGIVLYILSFISWLHVLRLLPLNIAYSLINVVHVLVPLGAWIFLGEMVSGRRWFGIGLILLGIVLIARPLARAEAKL